MRRQTHGDPIHDVPDQGRVLENDLFLERRRDLVELFLGVAEQSLHARASPLSLMLGSPNAPAPRQAFCFSGACKSTARAKPRLEARVLAAQRARGPRGARVPVAKSMEFMGFLRAQRRGGLRSRVRGQRAIGGGTPRGASATV